MLYAVLRPLTAFFMRLYWRVEARGVHHVPDTGAVLLVANHSSLADPPLIAGLIRRRRVSFLAKAELFRLPLFGRLIRALGANPVRREGGDPAALRTALRVLDSEGALLVFPEGTRGPEGTLRPGKPGAGMLAALSQAAVVPVYVSGSGRAWPRGRRWPRPTKVTVTFGPPIRFEGRPGAPRTKESYQAASQAMMAAIARLKDAGEPDPGSPRERRAVGEVGVGGASASPKYSNGRSGQHGEG